MGPRVTAWAQNGMNLVVHAEGARLVVRDVLRRPLAELELGEVHAVLRRLTPTVMQARRCFVVWIGPFRCLA